jgi:hypothetical protein
MYLDEQRVIEVKTNVNEPLPALLTQFATYLEERGLRPLTVKRYQRSMLLLLPKLGTSTEKYDITVDHRTR